MPRMHDKVSLITGAGRGIGAAIATDFVAEGGYVVVTDMDTEAARQVADQLGDQACAMTLDVREEAHWQAVMAEVMQRFGRLDVLVNNAGVTGFESGNASHDPEHASLDDWRAVHATNLDGVFLGCKHAIAAMRKTGNGSIINISSRSGLVGIPAAAAYASSKAAVRNHTKSVALYCAQEKLNIRCNSVHPAAILTPMWEPMLGAGPQREQNMAAFVADCPMRRFGQPEEVAALVLLLACDDAQYINGTELNIDGGMLAGSVASPTLAD